MGGQDREDSGAQLFLGILFLSWSFNLDSAITLFQRGTMRKYEYRRRLPHYQKDECPLFVTFRTAARQLLPAAARDLVLQHCIHDHGRKLQLHVAVVIPEHVHLLLTPLRDANGETFSLAELLQAIKSSSAHTINRLLDLSGPVWQEESFDHVVRGSESFKEKTNYIRLNPVRRGLAQRPEEYPWLWLEPGVQF